jgi:hypothetical protein
VQTRAHGNSNGRSKPSERTASGRAMHFAPPKPSRHS